MSTRLHLRSLTDEEYQSLRRITRKSQDAIARGRAGVILLAASGMTPSQIASSHHYHVTYIRKIINAFNRDGLNSLKARYGIGRPRTFNDEVCAKIIEVALTPPDKLGYPFTQWSLDKLRRCLIDQRIISTISEVHLRRILRRKGITHQRTKTWKQSPDPDFELKKNG
jgi:transposase